MDDGVDVPPRPVADATLPFHITDQHVGNADVLFKGGERFLGAVLAFSTRDAPLVASNRIPLSFGGLY